VKKKFAAVIAALLMLFGISVVAAPAASAGTCTVIQGLTWCGRVYNGTGSYVRTTVTWPATVGNIATVAPGQWSPYRDTDGFYIAAGKCFGLARGPVWFKITDTSTVYLNNNNYFNC